MSNPIEVPRVDFLNPEGNGVRILSLDGGDARCFSQLSILAELMHRLEYDYGRPVRPCEFFHSITGVGASGVIAILLGVLGMTVEEASTAFIGICEKVFVASVCNETCRSEIFVTELERVLESLNLRSDSLLAGNLARNAGCLVSICYSAAATRGCRMFRNYLSTQHSYNPTIVEAARSSWATPGLFSSIHVGPPLFAEELISAVNGFNNPTLQAVQEVREFYGADRAVSTFLSLGSGKRGPVSVHSSESLRRTAQQTDITEEDIERDLGLSGVYYRFSPEYTIEGDTFGVESNQFGSIMSYTRAYLESAKTRRAMESYLKASARTSAVDLNFRAEAQNTATYINQVPKTARLSLEERTLLQTLSIQGLECGSPLQGCMKGTREGILQRINDWTTDFTASNVLWLKGHPGIGKTAIATEVVEQLTAVRRLGSNFFFRRQEAASLTPLALWRTVAYDLARKHPTIRRTVIAKLEGEEAVPTTANLDNLFRHYIQDPLLGSGEIPSGRLPVVVIDALDECGGLEGQSSEHRKSLLNTLRHWSKLPLKFKLIVTSRGESDLDYTFSNIPHSILQISAGQTVDAQSSKDIRIFITTKLQEITQRYNSLPSNWPGVENVEKLVDTAAGLFIWAQTAVKFIQAGEPQRRLNSVLNGGVSGDIYILYETILKSSFENPDAEALNEYSDFRSVVGTIILAKDPLSLSSISALLSLETTSVAHVCTGLQSVLEYQNTLRFHHQTFVDFLLNQTKCPPKFFIEPKHESRKLTLACLRVMEDELRFNICGIETSCARNTSIPDLQTKIGKNIQSHLTETSFDEDVFSHEVSANRAAVTREIPAPVSPTKMRFEDLQQHLEKRTTAGLKYAAIYGLSHMASCLQDDAMITRPQEFFESNLLYWVELGAIRKTLPEYMASIHHLLSALESMPKRATSIINTAIQWCSDILEFLQTNQILLQSAPLDVYSTALLFTTRENLIYQHYERFRKLLPRLILGYRTLNANSKIMSGHKSGIDRISLSSDGLHLVSTAYGGDMMMWNAQTGASVWEFKVSGNPSLCFGVTILPDNTVVSVWSNGILYRLSGKATALHCNETKISSILTCLAWSPEWTWFAYGTEDGRIHQFSIEDKRRIWRPLMAHVNAVDNLSLSRDASKMASTSNSHIQIWNLNSDQPDRHTSFFHKAPVRDCSFNPVYPSLFAFVDGDSLHIHNLTGGKSSSRHCGPGFAGALVYSHHGEQVALRGIVNNSIRVFNLSSLNLPDAEIETRLETDHTGPIRDFIFHWDNRHLFTAGIDRTLRFRDSANLNLHYVPRGHQLPVTYLSISPKCKRIASICWSGFVCLWNVEDGARIGSPIDTNSGISTTSSKVALSSDGETFAFAKMTNDIKLWNTKARKKRPLKFAHPKPRNLFGMAFSPDDSKLAFTCGEWTNESGLLTILDIHSACQSAAQSEVTVELCFLPFRERLGFHPNGDYICCRDHVWKLTANQPQRVIGDSLSSILQETFGCFRFNNSPPPSISSFTVTLHSSTNRTFNIPPEVMVSSHTTCPNLLALGGHDGRVLLLDGSNLSMLEDENCFQLQDRTLLAEASKFAMRPQLSGLMPPLFRQTNASTIQWDVITEKTTHADRLFDSLDSTRLGYFEVGVAVPYFLLSGLPEDVLAHVWEHAGIRNNAQITKAQFAQAACLINNELEGTGISKVSLERSLVSNMGKRFPGGNPLRAAVRGRGLQRHASSSFLNS